MIDCLVFSKDRACQLDLLLRSIEDNFQEIRPKILFKATNENFKNGYDKVKSYHPQYEWIEENDFVQQSKGIINSFDNEFFLCLVDDEVVIKDYNIDSALELLRNNPSVHCFSIRMHEKINYCYTANLPSSPPKEYILFGNDIIAWEWRMCDERVEHGYPSCINSHIYRMDFIKSMINIIPYKNVNGLEGQINLQRHSFAPLIACYRKPKTVNIANNLVQTGVNRYSSNTDFSAENLNRHFLEGQRISIDNMYNYCSNTPTFEKDYIWLK